MALTQFLSKEEEIVKLIPEKLAEWINIELKETKTIWLFCSEGVIYSQYSEEAESIKRKNENYANKCQEISKNPYFNKDTEIQTSNPLTIDHEIQCEQISVGEIGCWSSSWDMYDSFNLTHTENYTNNCDEEKNINLLRKLNLIENLISLNLHQSVLVIFRNVIKETESTLALEPLWSLQSPIIENKSVTSLVLNKTNKDLLSAGYGTFDCDNRVNGLVCCWSLKNLLHPKCIIKCPTTVLSVDFSQIQPNKLACGLSNGIAMVFDVRSGQLIFDSTLANLYHLGPIWAIRWKQIVESQNLLKANVISEEKMITLSEDGTICQWTFDKGCQTKKKAILTLKLDNCNRLNLLSESLTKLEPFWDFDFKESILNSYFVSTKYGHIHKCTSKDSDKVQNTYFGHQGPVYKIRISPFVNSVILTCGADWTIKLWHEDKCCQQNSLLSLQTGINPVYDISWSPHSSTMFASVYPNRLDVWDLNINVLEPVLSEKSGWKETFTSVLFSETSNALYVGTDVGKIYVYAIKGGHVHNSEILNTIVDYLGNNRKR